MDKLKFKGVLINTEKDPRDYNISMFIPGEDKIEDEEFCLKLPHLNFIINQYQYNSCVGHSFAIAKSILEYRNTNKWIDIDPYMIYGTRLNGEYTGEGMYPYQGAKVLLKEGAYLRRDFGIQDEVPRLIDTVKKWKTEHPDKVQEAKNLVINSYCNVYTTNQIKKALKNGMVISAAFPIYDNFYETGEDGIVSLYTSKNELQGYHQMTIVGWTKNKYWIVINSWGIDYGLKGMYLIPFKYTIDSAISLSDTITPIKYKAKNIEFRVNSKIFKVDGNIKEFDSIPYINKNRTFVPIRFITEALGASVEWINNTQEVIIRSEEALIKLQIGSKIMTVNNKQYKLDVVPELKNDRTMLPIRAISEALNCDVSWNTGKVIINAL